MAIYAKSDKVRIETDRFILISNGKKMWNINLEVATIEPDLSEKDLNQANPIHIIKII